MSVQGFLVICPTVVGRFAICGQFEKGLGHRTSSNYKETCSSPAPSTHPCDFENTLLRLPRHVYFLFSSIAILLFVIWLDFFPITSCAVFSWIFILSRPVSLMIGHSNLAALVFVCLHLLQNSGPCWIVWVTVTTKIAFSYRNLRLPCDVCVSSPWCSMPYSLPYWGSPKNQ